jgi:hypothetical protein
MRTRNRLLHRPARAGSLLLGLTLILTGPAAAQQVRAESVPAVGEERFQVFVQVQVQIEKIRDELHLELARWHEVDRKNEVRRAGDERSAGVLEAHDILPDAFRAFTRLISTDQAAREAFEEIAARLREPTP